MNSSALALGGSLPPLETSAAAPNRSLNSALAPGQPNRLLRMASPAPYHTLAAMLAAQESAGACPKPLNAESLAKLQLMGGKTYGFHLAENCLACAGLAEVGDTLEGAPILEAWFACWPELGAHMLAFVRLAQLTLAELPHDAIVEAVISDGHRPGERLATLLGFTRTQTRDIWERRRT